MFLFSRTRSLEKAIKRALKDEVLTKDEFAEIEREVDAAGLSPQEAKALVTSKVQPVAQRMFDRILKGVVERGELSPDDESDIAAIRKDLGLPIKMELSDLAPYRFMWEINNHHPAIPMPIRPPIMLPADEACYLGTEAEWVKQKTIKEHHVYAGGSVRFRVARGVSVSVGRSQAITSTREVLATIFTGKFCVTGRRVMFVGRPKSSEMKLSQIADLVRYSDGIEIIKTRGSPEMFRMPQFFAAFAHALILNLVGA